MERYQETIAATATAPGAGGIGIVRISGEHAVEIADRVYRSVSGKKKLVNQKSHTIHYGYIYDGNQLIDEVMVSIMRAPRSYTAEDTVEINCHGGMLVTKKVLEAVLHHGAVPAEPGEFTRRAFLNGRIDLSEAEAVMDVISAKNNYALKASMNQLQGSMLRKIKEMRGTILDVIAYIEAALDDPEHISLDGYDKEMRSQLASVCSQLTAQLDRFEDGRMLREGVKTVILGKPNAGKSSLLNLFSGHDRAIVTEIAGTTRDTLEEQLTISGISFMMIDTAGIHETKDAVEQIGVDRAREAAAEADLILYIVDTSRPLDENDREVMKILTGKRCVILMNKSDLEPAVTESDIRQAGISFPVISISAKTEEGLDAFRSLVTEMFGRGEIAMNDEELLSNTRQKQCIEDARNSLQLVLEQSGEVPEDLLTIDLMNAYRSLGYVIGEEVEDDLVNRIFEKFCMGK